MIDKILFLLPEGSLNDATEYYINILQVGFEKSGSIVYRSSTLKDVRKYDKVLTIEAKWFFIAKLINPKANIMNWFQGVVAEEAYLTSNSKIRKELWHFFESFTLRYSKFNIYVSNEMKSYFETRYVVGSKKYFVMPCFNKELKIELINKVKYKTPSFVYAGSLAKWQCVEKTLELYSLIEKSLINSSITLLTKETKLAEVLVKKYKIKNYVIKYVSLDELDLELSKYKYGFILRDDHIVNNVATPTKMNSYLSVGVIPIFSNVIVDFNEKLNMNSFIRLDSKFNCKIWCEQILSFDNNDYLDQYENLIFDLKNIFSTYYNKKKYLDLLSIDLRG